MSKETEKEVAYFIYILRNYYRQSLNIQKFNVKLPDGMVSTNQITCSNGNRAWHTPAPGPTPLPASGSGDHGSWPSFFYSV